MRLSAYARELCDAEKTRYLQKVRLCDGVDPLDLRGEELCRDVALYPRVDFTDIKDYLVHTTSFVTREEFKAYKAMEGHNFLTSGWVQQPCLKVLSDGRVVIVCQVRHSQSVSDKPLTPWLIIKEDGEVQATHCTCKAGLGEACSHVAAVLFYIDAVVKRRDGQVCTDKENSWLPPTVRSVEPKKVSNVNFSSLTMRKRLMDGEEPLRKKKQRRAVKETTDAEWAEFLQACHSSGRRPALLSLEPNYAHHYIPVAVRFPQVILTNLQEEDVPGTWSETREKCFSLAEGLSIEPEVAELIEKETREQARSSKWFAFRAGRITASNVKAVCRTSTTNPSLSLLKRLCYPEHAQFSSPQTAWGKEHEQKATQAYVAASKNIHVNFKFSQSGLHICKERPFLAATPDGMVSCDCCGQGVLEVKCPYNSREESVRSYAMSDSSCLSIENDKVMLKTDHSYFYQVQMQIFVCKVRYCDFVVWTLKDYIVLRIYEDTQFCSRMLQRWALYFKLVILPELCYRYWTEKLCIQPQEVSDEDSAPQDEVYCVRSGPESGRMVMCDSKTCKRVWFHYQCVGLNRAPKGKKWYCPECTEQSKKA